MIQVAVVRRSAGAGDARRSVAAIDGLWGIGSRPVEVSECANTSRTVGAELKGDTFNGGA
jgi:hypothetical protein